MNMPEAGSRITRPASTFTFRLSPVAVQRVTLLLILLLAAYLRLNHLDWTEFKLDEAHLSQLAFNMARHGDVPLTGIGSSVGIVNLPLAAWLLALPFLFSPSPIVATSFVAAWNVLGVIVCYAFGRKFLASFGDLAWIGALFAAAPWAVIDSRKIWAQDLLPPIVIAYAWTGYRAFVERKPWSLVLHGLTLAALIQIHYSALWLIPVSAVWAFAFVRRVHFKVALASGLVMAAAFAPFLIADAVRGWPSINRLLEVVNQPAAVDANAVHFAWLMSTGQEIHSLAGPQEFGNYLASIPNLDGLQVVEGLLVLAGLIAALIGLARAIRHRAWDDRSATGLMLSAWLVLPIVLQINHRTPLYPHYFIILYPAQFLLVGLLVVRLPWRRLRWLVLGLAILIALAQTYQTLALQQFVATHSTPGGFGTPIGYYETIVDRARSAAAANNAADILIVARGADPAVDSDPAIFDFLLQDTPHRFADGQQPVWI
jgi:4-amino-4-deoxy-L-arabinose transferase-like glycosyltransferase